MAKEQSSCAWFRCAKPNPAAQLRLFCFPHGGGGASLFHAWWKHLPADIELWAGQPPGREDRLREPCHRRMSPLIETLLPQFARFLEKPFALLGHSMGALIAFELARQLRRRHGTLPTHLFVAARRAPQLPEPLPSIYRLAETEFIQQLRKRYQGMPDVIIDDPELRKIYLPILRADLELIETYAPLSDAPLACPISAIGGRDDSIPEMDLAAWAEHTTGRFRLHMMAGHHFFLKTSPAQFLRVVLPDLCQSLGRPQ